MSPVSAAEGRARGLAWQRLAPVCALHSQQTCGGDALTRRPHAQGRAW
jgi:hypothetical protein